MRSYKKIVKIKNNTQRDNKQELTNPCKLYVCRGFSLPKNGICREFVVNDIKKDYVLIIFT